MKTLRKLGFKTVAMALRDDSFSIDDPQLHAEEKLAIILGTEGDGLAAETIADCDYTVDEAKQVYAELEDMIENGTKLPQYRYIGLRK